MSTARTPNLPASVRQRLLNLARQRGQPFDLILIRYGIERLLFRLSRSPYADEFMLKGAMLFVVWGENSPRPTRDVDLLGFGPADETEVKAKFSAICSIGTEPDGLELRAESVAVTPIRAAVSYPGIQITLEAYLERARIPLQIDIGYGDAVTPAPQKVVFPSLLDLPAPQLNAYPVSTVVAEKLEAMVLLGMTNTRLKDFFDLWYLSRNFSFEGAILAEAISRTFARRNTTLPTVLPVALTADFAVQRDALWNTFLRRNTLDAIELQEVLSALREFLGPPIAAATSRQPLKQTWVPGRGWQ